MKVIKEDIVQDYRHLDEEERGYCQGGPHEKWGYYSRS